MARSFWFLLAGVAIGILIAPEKGVDTRKKITDLLEDYKDSYEKLKSKIPLSRADVEDSIKETLLY